jgi:hypothetical protein
MKQNEVRRTNQQPWHLLKKPTVVLAVILVIIAILGFAAYHNAVKPTCTFLSNTSSQDADGGINNQSVLSLARSLGAKGRVQACWGGISNATSIDGPQAAVRVLGSGTEALARIGCTVSSVDDAANGGWVGIAHGDFGNKDRVTGYYYGDGNKCNPGNMISVILTSKDSNGSNELYIVYYGGYH